MNFLPHTSHTNCCRGCPDAMTSQWLCAVSTSALFADWSRDIMGQSWGKTSDGHIICNQTFRAYLYVVILIWRKSYRHAFDLIFAKIQKHLRRKKFAQENCSKNVNDSDSCRCYNWNALSWRHSLAEEPDWHWGPGNNHRSLATTSFSLIALSTRLLKRLSAWVPSCLIEISL